MERERLEALYRRYGRMVFRRARGLLGGDVQAAHDAVQEVFVQALAARAEIDAAPSTVAWLCKATTTHCLGRVRELVGSRRPPAADDGSTIAERRVPLTALVARVPEELGEAAIYYYMDQMSQDEIAELLGVSRRTVAHRIEEFDAEVAALFPPAVEVTA